MSRIISTLVALLALTACGEQGASQSQASRLPEGAQRRTLVISRVMADPTAVPDDRGEWIEISNAGAAPVDLRGWQLRSGNDPGFIIPQSLVVPPGGQVILARNPDSSVNGGIHADLGYSGIVLGNAGDWVALRDPGGATVDSLAWNRAPAGRPIEHEASGVSLRPSPSRSARASGAPGAAPAAATGATAGPGQDAHELVVRVLDIGQGDAILIQNGGSTVLVDGGPNPQALGHHLDALGLNGGTIDAVILTHQHADHYQGLRELFASRRHIVVRYFWENQDPSPNVTLARLRDSIAARVAAGSLVYRDTDDPCATGLPLCTIALKGGAKLHIMRPFPEGDGANNRSVALKLVGPDSASFTMWMAGDAEHEAIDWFDRVAGYSRGPGMRAEVLKADHHGSCNGVTDRYLELVRPSLLVVSVGAVNDYGHMHDQAKNAYARRQIPWYRTDQNGTITIRSAGVPGARYSVLVEHEGQNLDGPSDRHANQPKCAGM